MNSHLPLTAISIKTLMDRWGLRASHIMLLHLNHDLQGVYKEGPAIPYFHWNEGEMIEIMLENDASFDEFELKMADILELEKRFPILLTKEYDKIWFSVDQLAVRWGEDESEVDDILTQFGAEIIDPVGEPVDYMMLVHPGGGRVILPASDFIYKRSDIDRIETELEITPSRVEPVSKALPHLKKFESAQLAEDNLRIHFRKNGDYWIIGPDKKNLSIKHLDGFSYIKILLDKRGEEISVSELSSLVNSVNPDPGNGYNQSSAKSDGLEFDQSQQELMDSRALEAAKEALEDKKERLKYSTDFSERESLEIDIEKLEKFLKEAEFRGKQRTFEIREMGNIRTNIRNRISTALKHIHKKIPIMESFLNEKSIRTGYKCSYEPDPEKKIEWITE